MLIEDILEQGEVLIYSFSVDSIHANMGCTITTSKRQISLALLELFYIKTHDCLQQQDHGRETDLVTPPSISALKSNGKGQP